MTDIEKTKREKEVAESIVMLQAVVLMDNLVEVLDALQTTSFYAKDVKYRGKMLLEALENRVAVFYDALHTDEEMQEFVKHTSALKECLNLVYATAPTDRDDLANHLKQFLKEIPASELSITIDESESYTVSSSANVCEK